MILRAGQEEAHRPRTTRSSASGWACCCSSPSLCSACSPSVSGSCRSSPATTYVASANDNRIRDGHGGGAPRGHLRPQRQDPGGEPGGLSVGCCPWTCTTRRRSPSSSSRRSPVWPRCWTCRPADLLDAYKKAKKDPYVTYVVKEDVPEDTVVAYLKEHSLEFPGVQVEKTYLRQYPFKALATHLLGYVGEISQNDLDQEEFVDAEGRGARRQGRRGAAVRLLPAGHRRLEDGGGGRRRPAQASSSRTWPPTAGQQPGADHRQRTAGGGRGGHRRGHPAGPRGRLHQRGRRRRGGHRPAHRRGPGHGLVPRLRPLAVGGRHEHRPSTRSSNSRQAHNPLFNRAINGLYPAGSTFKPFVAAAALNAGRDHAGHHLRLLRQVQASSADLEVLDSTDGHGGDVNLLQAIEQSCDVYFYNLGNLLYQQPSAVLQEGRAPVRLRPSRPASTCRGRPTAAGCPTRTGRARPARRTKTRSGRPGDEINLAIGQGDLLVTPLQLAVALSAIANANEGNASGCRTWACRSPTPPATSSTSSRARSGASWASADDDPRATIRRGHATGHLRPDAAPPTTPSRASPSPWPARPGTAEKKPDDDYALFMGYAPADGNSEPEIVVVAIIEQGGHGSSVAAPVVRRVMEAYFHTSPAARSPSSATE